MTRVSWFLTSAFCLVPLAFIARAQTRPAEPMLADFVAVTNDGRPSRDLKPEELTLKVDGKTRTIRSLQLVAAGDAPGSGLRTGPVPAPPPFDTNVVSRIGRPIMIVIDDESLPVGGERPIKDAIAQMTAELASTDRIAIATVPHGGLKVDFTDDRGRLEQALAPIVGHPSDEDPACQTRSVLQQTAGLLNGLDAAAGPTTFILLTGGLVGPRSEALGAGAVGRCELTPEHFQQLGQAAAEARAQFYLVQTEHDPFGALRTGLLGGNANIQVGLEDLAGVTGTQVLHIATTGQNLLSRIARETSAHYLVAFDMENADRRPGTHRMELKTSRGDVTLRARPLLSIARSTDSAAGARTPRDTLGDARPYRDLTLRSAAFVSRGPEQKVMIVATVEPLDPAAKLGAAVAGLYAGDRLVTELTARPEDLAKAPIKLGVLAPPGAYRLRVAGRDLAGRLGTVDLQVAADLTTAGPLKLSSLVLGVSDPSGTFEQKLEFSSEPAVTVFFELYGGRTNMQLGAAIELATSANGPAIATALPRWRGTSEADRFAATADLPIATLAPGDYVVRAIVGIEGQPEGRILRTLRKR